MALFEVSKLPWLAWAFILIVFMSLAARFYNPKAQRHNGKDLDVVGLPPGILPWTRALLGSFTKLAQTTRDGYEKFSKAQSRPFGLPTMWIGGAVVVLPPSQLNYLNKPDNELSSAWAIFDNIQLTYFIDRDILAKLIHFEVSRRDLTQKHVDRQAGPTADEVDACFQDIWGINTRQWRTVNGWDTCGRIIARVALRTIVGRDMCRNEVLLEQSRLFSNSIFAAAAIINSLPPFLRPVFAPFLALQSRRYRARCQKILVPLVKKRIRLWEASQKNAEVDLPNDFLQWLIPRCAGHGPEHLDSKKITMRLLTLNTMFVFGMSYVFAHTVIDICAHEERKDILSGIEDECRRRISEHPEGLASKEAIGQFYRADSTIRESMRISDVSVVGLPRDVVGVKPLNLGSGITVPPGTRTVFPTQNIHMDPDHYENPEKFDPFRFSRAFEQTGAPAEGGEARELLTTLTPNFLPFGYGKRACTGRWFVSQTLKQALAYLTMNYEVELVGDPPRRKALMNMMIPPVEAKLRLRRKIQIPPYA